MISISRDTALMAIIALMADEIRYKSEIRRIAPRESLEMQGALDKVIAAIAEVREALNKKE